MKITLKRSLMAVVCVLGMGSFVACDDDDDVKIPPVSTLSVQGYFEGTMSAAIDPEVNPTADETPATDAAIDFTIDDNNIKIAKFPVAYLVDKILGSGGEGIAALVGDLKYDIPYTATLNAEKTEISLTAAPKELVIEFGEGETAMKVTVSVEAVGTGLYTLASQNITFKLRAKSVIVNETPLPGFKPMTITFTAKKAVKK